MKCFENTFNVIEDIFDLEYENDHNLIIADSNSMDNDDISLIELDSNYNDENDDLNLFEEPNLNENAINDENNANNNNVIDDDSTEEISIIENLVSISESTIIDEANSKNDSNINDILNSIDDKLKENCNVERLIRNNYNSITGEKIELTFLDKLVYPNNDGIFNSVNVIGVIQKYEFKSTGNIHLFISDETTDNILIEVTKLNILNMNNIFKCGDIVSIRNLSLTLNANHFPCNKCNSMNQIIVWNYFFCLKF